MLLVHWLFYAAGVRGGWGVGVNACFGVSVALPYGAKYREVCGLSGWAVWLVFPRYFATGLRTLTSRVSKKNIEGFSFFEPGAEGTYAIKWHARSGCLGGVSPLLCYPVTLLRTVLHFKSVLDVCVYTCSKLGFVSRSHEGPRR